MILNISLKVGISVYKLHEWIKILLKKTVLKCKLGIRDTDILRGLFFESRKFQL